jgi:hypothetical protein
MNIEIIKPHRDGKEWVRRGVILRDVPKLRGEELVRLGIARPLADVQTSALPVVESHSGVADPVFVQTSAQKPAAGNPKKHAASRSRAQSAPADQHANASVAADAGAGQLAGVAPEQEAQGQAGAEPEPGADAPAAPAGTGDEPDQP